MTKRKTRSKNRSQESREGRAIAGSNNLWLYGEHAVRAALGNPRREIRRLVLTRSAARDLESGPGLGRGTSGLEVRVVETREAVSAVLPPGAVHQGLAAEVAPLSQPDLADLDLESGCGRSLIVLLDQVTDPQNVGAILRSACAFGAAAVVAPERHAADESGALAKAASGALDVIPYLRVVNLARALNQLKSRGYWCLGLDTEAEETIDRISAGAKVALVLGAEGAGLRRLTRAHCDFTAKLPTHGPVDQLNVSNAAAVALYALLASAPR